MRFRRSTVQYSNQRVPLSRLDLITSLAVAGAAVLIFIIGLTYLEARFKSLVDIKVPVATSKAKYAPKSQVSALFFGEVRYKGEVGVTRRLVCEGYTRPIDDFDDDANKVVENVSTPRKLIGNAIPVGILPEDAPIGQNCIIEFNNHYCIPYLFGCVVRDYPYYTQTFEIVSQEEAQKDPNAQPAGNITVPQNQPAQKNQENFQAPTSTNNGSTNNNITIIEDKPTYTECVADKQGLFPTVGGIVSCL